MVNQSTESTHTVFSVHFKHTIILIVEIKLVENILQISLHLVIDIRLFVRSFQWIVRFLRPLDFMRWSLTGTALSRWLHALAWVARPARTGPTASPFPSSLACATSRPTTCFSLLLLLGKLLFLGAASRLSLVFTTTSRIVLLFHQILVYPF